MMTIKQKIDKVIQNHPVKIDLLVMSEQSSFKLAAEIISHHYPNAIIKELEGTISTTYNGIKIIINDEIPVGSFLAYCEMNVNYPFAID